MYILTATLLFDIGVMFERPPDELTGIMSIVTLPTVSAHVALLGVWFALGRANLVVRMVSCSAALLVPCAAAQTMDPLPMGELYTRFLTLLVVVALPLQIVRWFTCAPASTNHAGLSQEGSPFRWELKDLIGIMACVAIITGVFATQFDRYSLGYVLFVQKIVPWVAVTTWCVVFFTRSKSRRVRIAGMWLAVGLLVVTICPYMFGSRGMKQQTAFGAGVFFTWVCGALIVSQPNGGTRS